MDNFLVEDDYEEEKPFRCAYCNSKDFTYWRRELTCSNCGTVHLIMDVELSDGTKTEMTVVYRAKPE